ncbi:MAG: hypothetical protein WAV90_04535, partial [Gordonia amarae]
REAERKTEAAGPLAFAGVDNVLRVASGELPGAIWSKTRTGDWVVVAAAADVPGPDDDGEVIVRVHKRDGDSEPTTLRVKKRAVVNGVETVVLTKPPRQAREGTWIAPGTSRRGTCDDCGRFTSVTRVGDMSGIPGWACSHCEDHASFA